MDMILVVNGAEYRLDVEARRLLCDVLREDCGLTGTHVGCEQGACGSCTVLLDGRPVRSCLLFAVQADGHELTTVEGLAGEDGSLHPIQAAFLEHGALQCGFCTPGFLVALAELAPELAGLDEERLRELLAGGTCRCTGYQGIVAAARSVAG
jgi:aerobic carbon-monoxide dehydrogenase small subunit